MSRAILTVMVDEVSIDDPLGLKEAASMALERFGHVRVTQVQIVEPEQMSMMGETKRPPRSVSDSTPASAPARPRDKPAARRQTQTVMECCYTCACYSSEQGRDSNGTPFWGTCGRTGRPVYELKNRCGGWRPLERTAVC